MNIRPLVNRDYEHWHPLWRAYLRFYRTEINEAITLATFQRLSEQTDGFVGLVAEGDDDDGGGGPGGGGLVGLAHLQFHPSTWSTEPYCYLEDLFVAPSGRGKGVSAALLEAVYAEADKRGAARTYWETQEFNGPARSLYDQVAHRTSFVIYER